MSSSPGTVLLVWLLGVSAMAAEYEQTEVYTDLRQHVLSLTSDQLGIKDDNAPLAVLMETGYPEAVATLVAVADGSSSLYFSDGGGIIGAGEHQRVRDQALELIKIAQQHLGEMHTVTEFPLPKQNHTRFYVITGNGIYSEEALEESLGLEKHVLSPVFHQGHQLISHIRAAEEQYDAKKEN